MDESNLESIIIEKRIALLSNSTNDIEDFHYLLDY